MSYDVCEVCGGMVLGGVCRKCRTHTARIAKHGALAGLPVTHATCELCGCATGALVPVEQLDGNGICRECQELFERCNEAMAAQRSLSEIKDRRGLVEILSRPRMRHTGKNRHERRAAAARARRARRA